MHGNFKLREYALLKKQRRGEEGILIFPGTAYHLLQGEEKRIRKSGDGSSESRRFKDWEKALNKKRVLIGGRRKKFEG